jgi:hypothetical protein
MHAVISTVNSVATLKDYNEIQYVGANDLNQLKLLYGARCSGFDQILTRFRLGFDRVF